MLIPSEAANINKSLSLVRGDSILGTVESCPCTVCPNYSLMCQFTNNDGDTNARAMFYTTRSCPMYIKIWKDVVAAEDTFYILTKENNMCTNICSFDNYEQYRGEC